MVNTDVFIVGGGPAGLAAAIAARRRGLAVVVADQARPPIDKACGEGLMPDSADALAALGVALEEVPAGTFAGIRFLCGDQSVQATFPRGNGWGVRRIVLHEALVERALAAGVRLLWESRVTIAPRSVWVNGAAVRSKWIIGADGNLSRLRRAAGLDRGRSYARRFALRQHFSVAPWSPYVEVYWGERGQAYVTPVSASGVCVAMVSRRKFESFQSEIRHFPNLARRLAGSKPASSPRGGITFSRRFNHVVCDNLALIGEAAGSVDAVTGEGLALAFRQAEALAQALASGDLWPYQTAHRQIMCLPELMGRTMLLMDKSDRLRRLAFRSFTRQPGLFERMLAIHVGETPFSWLGRDGALSLGWQLLAA